MPRLLSPVFRILSPDSSLNTLIEETGDRRQEDAPPSISCIPYSVSRLLPQYASSFPEPGWRWPRYS